MSQHHSEKKWCTDDWSAIGDRPILTNDVVEHLLEMKEKILHLSWAHE